MIMEYVEENMGTCEDVPEMEDEENDYYGSATCCFEEEGVICSNEDEGYYLELDWDMAFLIMMDEVSDEMMDVDVDDFDYEDMEDYEDMMR